MPASADTRLAPTPSHALELRRWALTCLSQPRSVAAPDDVPQIREITPSTWRLFLAAERCAAPLADCPDEVIASLPRPAQELLKAAATAELKRILAARSQLQTLSDLARDIGCQPIVIRGGAFLTSEDRSYDLDDLDIVLPAAEARSLARALDAAGYETVGSSSYRHLSGRSAPGLLNVEIHLREEGGDGLANPAALEDLRPIPGLPGLARPNPLEHAWSILVHVTVDHIYRRGRIRDLLLLGGAISQCSSADRSALQSRTDRHPARRSMAAQLAMAAAINASESPSDAFESVALTNYVLRSRAAGSATLPGNLRMTAAKWVFAILGGPTERRTVWAETTAATLEPSPFRFIAWVQRRQPGLGRIWLRLFRILRVPFALMVAVPMVMATRRELRKAGLEPRVG